MKGGTWLTSLVLGLLNIFSSLLGNILEVVLKHHSEHFSWFHLRVREVTWSATLWGMEIWTALNHITWKVMVVSLHHSSVQRYGQFIIEELVPWSTALLGGWCYDWDVVSINQPSGLCAGSLVPQVWGWAGGTLKRWDLGEDLFMGLYLMSLLGLD